MVICPVNEQYSNRLSHQKEYREDELSDEDEYLCKSSMNMVASTTFITNCEKCDHGDCPVHGPLLILDPSSGHD